MADTSTMNTTPHGSTPVPDPTLLTSASIFREITALEKLLTTRLDGMDKALDLFHQNITRVPTDTDKQVGTLRDLLVQKFAVMDEKFKSVQTQFAERDVRTEQTSRDSKVAVDAALQAAKEAVEKQNTSSALAIAKSEAATTKQIDQLVLLIQSTNAAMNEKVDDVKERMTVQEAKQVGHTEEKGDTHTASTWTLALVLGGFSLVSMIIAIVGLLKP